MRWEPRPTPEPTSETARYWRAAAEGRLLVGHCHDCDLHYHYPRVRCPDCLGDDTDWVECSGRGTVYSYTVVYVLPDWPLDPPLVQAYVELEEGPRLLTVVDAPPEAVEVDDPVEVRFAETDDNDIGVPFFVPES